jgi:hypothetical protein
MTVRAAAGRVAQPCRDDAAVLDHISWGTIGPFLSIPTPKVAPALARIVSRRLARWFASNRGGRARDV